LKQNGFLLVLKRKVPAIEVIARIRKGVDEHPFLIAHYKDDKLISGMTCSQAEAKKIIDCVSPLDVELWNFPINPQ
jgi:hypothetical protein